MPLLEPGGAFSSSLRRCENNRAGHPISSSFGLSLDELSHVVLMRILHRSSEVLGAYVRNAFQRVYGEVAALSALSRCLSRRMMSKLHNDPTVVDKDIYVITDVIMGNLDSVFFAHAPDLYGLASMSELLRSVAMDVDCVSQTRTCLFHGVEISAHESHRCAQSLKRLCGRLLWDEEQSFKQEDRRYLEEQEMVSIRLVKIVVRI